MGQRLLSFSCPTPHQFILEVEGRRCEERQNTRGQVQEQPSLTTTCSSMSCENKPSLNRKVLVHSRRLSPMHALVHVHACNTCTCRRTHKIPSVRCHLPTPPHSACVLEGTNYSKNLSMEILCFLHPLFLLPTGWPPLLFLHTPYSSNSSSSILTPFSGSGA